MKHEESLLLGAHTSAAGGVQNAIYEGRDIGATTVQLFTANQRTWQTKPLAQEEITLFQKAIEETGLSHIMSHASYLVNMGSPREDVAAKSRKALYDEVVRCKALNLSYLVFHPGASLDDSREACLHRIVKGLLSLKDLFTGEEKLEILVETTAGQGSNVGSSFEELSFIIDRVKGDLPIGVCIDTCHIFAAGYDIRDEKAFHATLQQFDKVCGQQYIKAFHLNDSQRELNSHVDRHEQLGDGMIGLDAFRLIMKEPSLRKIPKYLETPGGPAFWKKEIALLKSFVH